MNFIKRKIVEFFDAVEELLDLFIDENEELEEENKKAA
jgi:cell division septum initiation protein DivIVA